MLGLMLFCSLAHASKSCFQWTYVLISDAKTADISKHVSLTMSGLFLLAVKHGTVSRKCGPDGHWAMLNGTELWRDHSQCKEEVEGNTGEVRRGACWDLLALREAHNDMSFASKHGKPGLAVFEGLPACSAEWSPDLCPKGLP